MDKTLCFSCNWCQNTDANSNNTIFTIKDTKLNFPVATLSAEEIKNYQHSLAKDLKVQCVGMNIKQKVKIKIQQKSKGIFQNQTLQFLTNCLFQFIQIKIIIQKGIQNNSKQI